MTMVYKCDICGKVEPRSIRRIITKNPAVNVNQPINNEEYYCFNRINADICDECLQEIETAIATRIYEMQEERRRQK